jgi:ABC-type transport system involved in multi-copper enzyme maturation permease subunit
MMRGSLLVLRQEFRVRLRTGRWRWLLAAWVVVVGLFTLLLTMALEDEEPRGIPLFGGLMLFVLGLVLVVSPALTAQSINGDRERGTLATLQVTRLSATEIAVGKLLAGWAVGLGALVLTLPFVGWAIALGGIGPWRVLVVLGVVVLLIGVVCAVSQALSALLARSITSALLSYVTVFALTVGTLIAFYLGAALTEESVTMTDNQGNSWQEETYHTERVWWLLAPNPFVVLADAAPQLPADRDPVTGEYRPRAADPLGELGRSVREIRVPQNPERDSRPPLERYPVWPYGLGFDLALGAGALFVTARRLRTPAVRLPRGVRVA